MDWAMKFTQMKYREKQSKWYGKRGLNWHVSCIISKSDTEHHLEVASYVHLFDSCAQDWYAVLSIVTHLLKTAKATQPQITKAYLR
jgi:predicted aminopeptidase